jgi:hypothetical protein
MTTKACSVWKNRLPLASKPKLDDIHYHDFPLEKHFWCIYSISRHIYFWEAGRIALSKLHDAGPKAPMSRLPLTRLKRVGLVFMKVIVLSRGLLPPTKIIK